MNRYIYSILNKVSHSFTQEKIRCRDLMIDLSTVTGPMVQNITSFYFFVVRGFVSYFGLVSLLLDMLILPFLSFGCSINHLAFELSNSAFFVLIHLMMACHSLSLIFSLSM